MNRVDKLLQVLIKGGLIALAVLIFSQQIEFTSLDLGRHLANGREVWHNSGLLFTNFYSYTEPEYSFVNHHWLFGVIYYALYLLGGFSLLSVFNIAIWLVVLFFAWKLARYRAGFYWASFLSLPAIVLLSGRADIRPENISYLFILLVWLLLEKSQADGQKKRLWWLVPLFLVWVNVHIYFFIGLALLAFWALAKFLPPAWQKLFSQGGIREVWLTGWQAVKPWFKYLISATLVCLLNPNTWRGFFYPFNILRDYGYEVAENKTIFFLEHLMYNPNFFLFKLTLVTLVVSFVAYWLVRRNLKIFEILLALFFSGLALFASRNLAIFSLVAWILASRNFSELSYLSSRLPYISQPEIGKKIKLGGAIFLLLVIVFFGLYLWSDSRGNRLIMRHGIGWGVAAGSLDSSIFFHDSGLSGPIFNNYDLGSALAFWLYPQEKVFVDNRPEAYSVQFFKEIYKPMQENAFDWQKYRALYDIKTIYFSHTDGTPWARNFLRSILSDKEWALVYVDKYVVILADRQKTNLDIINQYALTAPALRVRLRELAYNSDSNSRLYVASLAETAGQADIAIEIYRQIILEDGDDVRALASLGSLYAASGNLSQTNQAISYLSRAIYGGRKLPGIYNERGLVYFNQGEYKKAANDWNAALKLESGNTSALSYLEQLKELQKQGSVPSF